MIQRPGLLFIAALILHEIPTWVQAIGIVLVVVGINFAKVKRAALPLDQAALQPSSG
jgi:drug/metabolite transporter (DMT)-like permease